MTSTEEEERYRPMQFDEESFDRLDATEQDAELQRVTHETRKNRMRLAAKESLVIHKKYLLLKKQQKQVERDLRSMDTSPAQRRGRRSYSSSRSSSSSSGSRSLSRSPSPQQRRRRSRSNERSRSQTPKKQRTGASHSPVCRINTESLAGPSIAALSDTQELVVRNRSRSPSPRRRITPSPSPRRSPIRQPRRAASPPRRPPRNRRHRNRSPRASRFNSFDPASSAYYGAYEQQLASRRSDIWLPYNGRQ